MGLQTRVGEEQRQQDHHHHRLQQFAHALGECPARQAGAEDEAAEHGVDADGVHRPRAQEEQGHDPGQHRRRQRSLRGNVRRQRLQQAAAGEQHEGQVGHAATDGEPGLHPAAAEAGQHDGQDAPRRRIVHGAGGQRQRAQRRSGQATLVDDPRQHRKRGDGDGGAQEQRDLDEAGLFREQPRDVLQPGRQREGEQERHQDARPGHRHRAAVARAEMIGAELGAHQEHVHAHADLPADIEHVHRGLREQRHLRVRQQRTQQGRT